MFCQCNIFWTHIFWRAYFQLRFFITITLWSTFFPYNSHCFWPNGTQWNSKKIKWLSTACQKLKRVWKMGPTFLGYLSCGLGLLCSFHEQSIRFVENLQRTMKIDHRGWLFFPKIRNFPRSFSNNKAILFRERIFIKDAHRISFSEPWFQTDHFVLVGRLSFE